MKELTESTSSMYPEKFKIQLGAIPRGVKKINDIDLKKALSGGNRENIIWLGTTPQGKEVVLKLARSSQAFVTDTRVAEFLWQEKVSELTPYVPSIDFGHVALPYDDNGKQKQGEFSYLVTEYFPEGSLYIPLHGIKTADPLQNGLLTVAIATDKSHSLNIVHRDLKPKNILMKKERGYLTDFGLAFLNDEPDDEHTTYIRNGQIIGTFEYAPPEQIHDAFPITKKADIFAFTGLAIEILDGDSPMPKYQTPDLRVRSNNVAYASYLNNRLHHFSSALQDVFRAGIAYDPQDRPSTAMEVYEQIERAMGLPVRTHIEVKGINPLVPKGEIFPNPPIVEQPLPYHRISD